MWKVRIFTLYPEMFPGPLNSGIYKKGLEKGLWSFEVVNIRNYANDKHKSVDDTPFGGGSGMLMRADVIANSLDSNISDKNESIIYLSPKGKKFDQNYAKKIKETYNLNENLCKFLSIRGIEIEKIDNFINPTIKNNLPNPESIKDMNVASEVICSHIEKRNNIGIFGDYDVDGATSTALLGKKFKKINQPFEVFIPDRIKNGYGPSRHPDRGIHFPCTCNVWRY